VKLSVIFEDLNATLDKLKKLGISKLSQRERDEIDNDYKRWSKDKKKRQDTPLEFNEYLKSLGLEIKQDETKKT
jgi:hypothetical protein